MVSAAAGAGLDELTRELSAVMAAQAEVAEDGAPAPQVLRPGADRLDAFTVEPARGAYVVRGARIERLFAKADLDNDEAVRYLQEVIERAGLNDALRRAGAAPGDTVIVGETEFEFS